MLKAFISIGAILKIFWDSGKKNQTKSVKRQFKELAVKRNKTKKSIWYTPNNNNIYDNKTENNDYKNQGGMG